MEHIRRNLSNVQFDLVAEWEKLDRLNEDIYRRLKG